MRFEFHQNQVSAFEKLMDFFLNVVPYQLVSWFIHWVGCTTYWVHVSLEWDPCDLHVLSLGTVNNKAFTYAGKGRIRQSLTALVNLTTCVWQLGIVRHEFENNFVLSTIFISPAHHEMRSESFVIRREILQYVRHSTNTHPPPTLQPQPLPLTQPPAHTPTRGNLIPFADCYHA